jgi:hypothetical protein
MHSKSNSDMAMESSSSSSSSVIPLYACMVGAATAMTTALHLSSAIDLQDRDSLLHSSLTGRRRRRRAHTRNNSSSLMNAATVACLFEDQETIVAVVERSSVLSSSETTAVDEPHDGHDHGPWYIKPRSSHWWDLFSKKIMREDPERFRRTFRVSVTTFGYICSLVKQDLAKHPPAGLRSIPGREMGVQKIVAVALRRLATGDSLVVIGDMFGIAESTASRVVWSFVKALCKKRQNHLRWPQGDDELIRVKKGFAAKHGLPQVCGAIDCSHIRLDLPRNEKALDWYDKDQNYSMVVQAIVDSEMRFLDVFAGLPGCLSDAQIYNKSSFQALVKSGQRLHGATKTVLGVKIGEYLLGDVAYAVTPQMVTPFSGTELAPIHDQFNFKHASLRMVVDSTFARLKGVWKILHRPMPNPSLQRLPNVILACCLLHNIMLEKADHIDDGVALVGHHDEGYRQQINCSPVDAQAKLVQQTLAQHVYHLEGAETSNWIQ